MKLRDLVQRFNTEVLDTWDGTDWVLASITGTLHVYDRFITERTFGVKKRLFVTHDEPPSDALFARTADGKICLLEAVVPDYDEEGKFRNVLTLRETNAVVTITNTTAVTNAAGVATGRTDTTTTTLWGDVDRYSSRPSGEFKGIVHETDIVMLPGGTPVSTDSKVTVNGILFRVNEIGRVLNLRELRGVRGD